MWVAFFEEISEMNRKYDIEELDLVFLLVVHLVCADEQIHIEETRRLEAFSKERGVNENTLIEADRILNQEDDRLLIRPIAANIDPDQWEDTFRLLIAFAYVDGFCDPLEERFLDEVARVWDISQFDKERMRLEAETSLDPERKETDDLLHVVREAFPEITDQPETVQFVEGLQEGVLFSEPEYKSAISKCTAVAKKDIAVAEKGMKESIRALERLKKSFDDTLHRLDKKAAKASSSEAQQLRDRLETDCEILNQHLEHLVEEMQVSFQRRKRAARFFTISFLGKTKAGKSTLHAVITGEGWDAIGVGRQRTTKLNRVYEWNNLRFIDTPGIGAPGGKSDEEIAKGIIDESDIICFVLTNNNQQEGEFKFLRLLKDRAKPLVILLNVKDDLTKPLRLKRFLKTPERLFSDEEGCLGGHYNRIRRFVEKFYGNESSCSEERDYLKIIPVHLLAAQLARTGQMPEYGQQLFQNCRVQRFLDELHQGLIKYGNIRRSQTLLGSTVWDIQRPATWVSDIQVDYEALLKSLQSKKETLLERIDVYGDEGLNDFKTNLKNIFNTLLEIIPSFADDHWDCEEDVLNKAWKQVLQEIEINERVDTEIKMAQKQFSNEVRDIVLELGLEMTPVSSLQVTVDKIAAQDANVFWRNLFTWGGNFGLAATSIALWFGWLTGVIGWILIFGSIVARFMRDKFASKAKKRQKAVYNITVSVSKNIERQRDTCMKKYLKEFKDQITTLITETQRYYDLLLNAVHHIRDSLEKTDDRLQHQVDQLNHAYADRIIAWIEGGASEKPRKPKKRPVRAVERVLGKHMKIYLDEPPVVKEQLETMASVFQEHISFETYFNEGRKRNDRI